MPRLHLIELHEQSWYPAALRAQFQSTLGRTQSQLGVYKHVAPHFARFLQRLAATEVLDLCSGAAGPLLRMRRDLEAIMDPASVPQFVLSDLFPPLDRFEALAAGHPESISFHASPVNAMSVPDDAPRVRTMFSALHHFQPQQVRAIFEDAARNADGFAAFESTRRQPLQTLSMMGLPLLFAGIGALRARPPRVADVLWHVALPVIPLTAAIDGVVSCLRSYTNEELRELAASIDVDDFVWEVGTEQMGPLPLEVQYVFGWRPSAVAAASAVKTPAA